MRAENTGIWRPRRALAVVLSVLLLGMAQVPGVSAAQDGDRDDGPEAAPLVLNGREASVSSYPWLAQLYRADTEAPYHCTASLIARRWVLTAAHCVDDASPAEVRLVFDRQTTRVSMPQGGVRVTDIHIHREWRGEGDLQTGVEGGFDAALMRLASSPGIDPVDVSYGPPGAGTSAWSIGWGSQLRDQSATPPQTLKRASVEVRRDRRCQDLMDQSPEGFEMSSSTTLCVEPRGNQPGVIRSGDSGGPLIVRNGQAWRLVGVVSYTIGAQDVGFYQEVDELQHWIRATVAGEPVRRCRGQTATIVARAGRTTVGTNGPDVIVGTRGADRIEARGGNDTICGRNGADRIYGEAGNDTIEGSHGDDWLRGGSGRDLVMGNQGDDEIWGGGGRDRLEGGHGSDHIWGGRHADEILAGPGMDHIWGEAGGDLINGGGSSDVIRGGSADDIIYGGPGGDSVHGGRGNDELRGEGGPDTLRGNAGTDTCYGGPARDTLRSCERPAAPSRPDLVGAPNAEALFTTFAELWQGGDFNAMYAIAEPSAVAVARQAGIPQVAVALYRFECVGGSSGFGVCRVAVWWGADGAVYNVGYNAGVERPFITRLQFGEHLEEFDVY